MADDFKKLESDGIYFAIKDVRMVIEDDDVVVRFECSGNIDKARDYLDSHVREFLGQFFTKKQKPGED